MKKTVRFLVLATMLLFGSVCASFAEGPAPNCTPGDPFCIAAN